MDLAHLPVFAVCGFSGAGKTTLLLELVSNGAAFQLVPQRFRKEIGVATGIIGTTAAAEEQASVAAANLAGDVQALYAGSMAQNILKVAGFELASLGMVRPPADDMSYEEIVFLDRGARIYLKCVLRDDRLVGALLVGDQRELPLLRDWVRSGEELGARRATLLRGGDTRGARGGGKIVCSCMSVDEGTLASARAGGAHTLQALMDATTAGTGCGSCRPELVSMLRAHPAGVTDPPLPA